MNIDSLPQIKGMTVIPPTPRHIRQFRSFNRAELLEALRLYLECNGIEVPQGREFVTLHDRDSEHGDRYVTFGVDVEY